MHIQLSGIDYTILLVYFAFVIGIGWMLKRYMKGARTSFFRVVPFPPGSPDWRFSQPTSVRKKSSAWRPRARNTGS